MNKLSFMDKLRILFTVSKNSLWSLFVLGILIILGILFFKTDKKNEKRNKRIYIIVSSLIGVIILITYQSSIRHIIDYLMNHIFLSILFPNFAIYFLGIIITNIILWISLFHYKVSDKIKRINVVVYIILNYLFLLILNVIDIQKLDFLSEESLYQSEKATALIELSSFVFTLWILFLILYKIILIYLRKDYKEKVKKVVVKQPIKILPSNYQPTTTPEYIFGNPGKRITLIETNPNHLLEKYENSLTLEDYQLLLKLLKEAKNKKKSTKITLENSILEMKKKDKKREEEKYTELERLYRGIH